MASRVLVIMDLIQDRQTRVFLNANDIDSLTQPAYTARS
jgi:hypothetical protein